MRQELLVIHYLRPDGSWATRSILCDGKSEDNVCCGRCPVSVVFSFSRASVFGDNSEQSVFFVGDSSGEKDAVAEDQQIPQPIKLERSAIESVETKLLPFVAG
jgi:hypothetical protein